MHSGLSAQASACVAGHPGMDRAAGGAAAAPERCAAARLAGLPGQVRPQWQHACSLSACLPFSLGLCWLTGQAMDVTRAISDACVEGSGLAAFHCLQVSCIAAFVGQGKLQEFDHPSLSWPGLTRERQGQAGEGEAQDSCPHDSGISSWLQDDHAHQAWVHATGAGLGKASMRIPAHQIGQRFDCLSRHAGAAIQRHGFT